MTVPRIAMRTPEGPDGAPLLVLGASLGTSSILWESTRPHLDRFRIVTWELPGHGGAPVPDEPFSIEEIADAVAAGIREVRDRDEPVRYAGVSLTGAVGLALLLRHPDLITEAVIACSGAKIGESDAWRQRAESVRSIGTGSLIVGAAERWFAPGSIAAHPDLTGRLLNVLREIDDRAYAWCCDALADFDVRDRLGEIAAPVLAIWGGHDAVTPEADLLLIADRVQHGRATGIPEASHLPTVDAPEAVAAAIDEFFGGTNEEVRR